MNKTWPIDLNDLLHRRALAQDEFTRISAELAGIDNAIQVCTKRFDQLSEDHGVDFHPGCELLTTPEFMEEHSATDMSYRRQGESYQWYGGMILYLTHLGERTGTIADSPLQDCGAISGIAISEIIEMRKAWIMQELNHE